MKKKHTLLMGAVSLWITLISVSALAVPQYISYQGKLTDGSGNSLTGAYDMRFYLCDAVTGGTCPWNETQTIAVTSGIYNVQLGDVTSFPASLFNTALYLEVLVSDDSGATWETLTPRQQVTTAAYAMKAQDADTLDGNLPADFAATVHDHDADYVNEGQSNSIWSHMIVDGTITAADLGADSVGVSEIASGAVGSSEIAAGAVTSTKIADGATLAEILDDDGIGSGLDADMLDGLHAGSFTQTSQDYGRSGVAANLYEGATTLTAKYVNEGQAGSITSGMLVDGSTLAEILDDDGPASGLDADLLDGYHEYSFFRLNQNETVTGRPNFYGGTSGSTAPFQVDSTFKVTGLNADMLDGYSSINFSLTSHWHNYLNASDGSPSQALYVDADGDVGIGTTTPGYPLHVSATNKSRSAYIRNDGSYTGSSYGLYVYGADNTTGGTNPRYGIYASSNNDYLNYGGYFRGAGTGTASTFGLYGSGLNTNSTSAGTAYGGYFTSYSNLGTAYGSFSNARAHLNTSTATVYGAYNNAYHNGAGGRVYGSYSYARGSDAGDTYGSFGSAYKYSTDTGGVAYGGYFVGQNNRTGGYSYGLYSEATGLNGPRYGLYNKVITSGTSTYSNYGVYSEVKNTNGGTVYGYYGNLDTGGSSSAYGAYLDIDAPPTATGSLRGYYANISHSGTAGYVYGAHTSVIGSDTGNAYGYYGYAWKPSSDTSGTAYGGYFIGDTDWTGGESYGVYARATGYNGDRYGVYSKVIDSAGTGYFHNYGVYAEVENDHGYAYGVRATVTHTGSTGVVYGVSATAYSSSGSPTYGASFTAFSDTGDTGSLRGIYAYVDNDTSGSKYAGYFYKSGGGNYAGYFSGNVYVSGAFTASGTKSFVQPHKDDPTKEIVYVAIEGPETRVVLDGRADLVDGEAFIDMPEAWQQVAAAEGITVTVTPMGGWAPLYVESVSVEVLIVKSADIDYGDVEFSYHITALRDGFQGHEAIQDNIHFTADNMSAWQFEDQYGEDTLDNKAIKGMLKKNGIMTANGKLDKGKAAKLGWKVKDDEKDPHYRKAHGLPDLEEE